MKSGITGMVLIALFTNVLCYAQNDTPMEVLVNIANENERFIPMQIFSGDDRPSDYLEPYLENYALLKLNQGQLDKVLAEGTENITITLPSPEGGVIETKLINHDIRAEGFAIADKLTSEEYEIPRAQFYRGVVKRGNDSQAGFSFFNDEVYGLFSTLEMGNIIVSKDPINAGNGSNYIIYFEKDLLIERNMSCGSDDIGPFKDVPVSATKQKVYYTCQDIELYIEATKNLYDARGSIASVSNYITAFFNNVSILYRNESIYTSLKRITVNTTEDGYTSLTTAFDKLNRFGEDNQNNYQQYGAELAHLVDIAPGIGGVAWMNTLCSNYRYYSTQDYHHGAYAYSSIENQYSNFPDYSLTVFMFTHEMGHNLGSEHTQWCGWDGGAIDNCTITEGGCPAGPAPTTGGTIMSYCHNASYGINYSNGFGTQPGDVIRAATQAKTCMEENVPTRIVSTAPYNTVTANRECTDQSGWTHYYYDNNTSDESDDELVLSVKKEGENIGNLDDGTLLVQLKTSSNAGDGSTHISNPGYNTGEDWHVMNRWFELVPTSQPNNPVTVRFPYTTDDFVDVILNQPAIINHEELIFYKVNSPGNPNPDFGHTDVSNSDITFYMNGTDPSLDTWKYSSNGSAHYAEFQVSSFSGGGGGFTENVQAALPVELMSFTAEGVGDWVELSWTTAMEVNNDFFTVERSTDGKQFEEIGKVSGIGNSTEEVDYDFIDRNRKTGLNYYRLSQTDLDGNHIDLGIRVVEIDREYDISFFPNPLSGDHLQVKYDIRSEGEVKVEIRNIEGRLVLSQSLEVVQGGGTIPVNMSDVGAGIYLVQIIGEGFVVTNKLIKD